MVSIDVRRASDRFVTRSDGMTTHHSFSYGAHYDPTNVGFGPLVALNDEELPPGTGYDDHRHAATEIVTWVLEGQLQHTDSLGNTDVLEPGTIARAGTGAGILHSERATDTKPVRFLQMMLRPEHVDADPSYDVGSVAAAPGLHQVLGPDAMDLGVPGARLLAGKVEKGDLELPDAPLLHVFVVSGAVTVGDDQLGPADAARLVEEGGRTVAVDEPSTLAVWAFS
jgi:redox-sensitive bicupin YhaK (pirin superfamily)